MMKAQSLKKSRTSKTKTKKIGLSILTSLSSLKISIALLCVVLFLIAGFYDDIVLEKIGMLKPVDVFEIDQNQLSGEATLSGYLRYDPASTLGSKYYLILNDGSALVVDSGAKGFKPSYINNKIIVDGTIIPLPESDLVGIIVPVLMKAE